MPIKARSTYKLFGIVALMAVGGFAFNPTRGLHCEWHMNLAGIQPVCSAANRYFFGLYSHTSRYVLPLEPLKTNVATLVQMQDTPPIYDIVLHYDNDDLPILRYESTSEANAALTRVNNFLSDQHSILNIDSHNGPFDDR